MLELIIAAIIIATMINLFFKRYHIPTIVGYISTGLFLSYIFGISETANNENLSNFAEFGIVLLMFTIGIEFSMQKLFKMKYKVFVTGGLQFFITGLLIYAISDFIFGIGIKSSIIIACGVSLSSTAIVLKTLNKTKEIKKKYGQQSLGILLFQDLAVIPVLLLISIFASSEEALGLLLLETLISGVILILLLVLVGKFLFSPFLKQVYKTKSNQIFIGAIFSIVLGASYMSHYFGFSYSLGALIAGVLIAETHYKHQIQADLLPFRELLLGMFFITVGMQLNIGYIIDNVIIILPLLLGIIIIKIGIIYLVSLKNTNKHISLKTALSLFQVGEFGIVVFKLATTNGLLTDNISQILIVITILSMILTPFVLKHLEFLIDILTSDYKNYKDKKIEDSDTHNAEKQIVLIGYGRLGKEISEILDKAKVKYLIIERYPKVAELGRNKGKNIILGDASNKHLLKALNIKNAKAVIISVGNTERLYHVCHTISHQVKKQKIIVKVNRYEEKDMLKKLKLGHIIVETEATALGMLDKL